MSVDRHRVGAAPRPWALAKSRAQGLSLIEMLVALVVVSVGLLGMAGLQAYSLRMNTSAYHRTQANTLAYDILDAMRTNRETALAGGYNVAFAGSCSGGNQAASDRCDWLELLEFLLPFGAGEVVCDNATQVCRVTVVWDDARALSSGHCRTSPDTCQQLTVSTRL